MAKDPRQITLRHPSPALAQRLKTLAEARGQSMNATILQLLEEAVGVEARRERLKRWATWTEEDAAEFDAALDAQRQIDVDAWR
jgi:hypothetical protein